MPALPRGPFPWIRYDPITGYANRANFDHNALQLDNFRLRGADRMRELQGRVRPVDTGDSQAFGIRKDGDHRQVSHPLV